MSTQKALSKELQEIFETDGTLLVGTGTGFSTLAPGTDDQVLTVVDGAPAWADSVAGTGAVDFVDLGDAPASYTGAASKFVKVNATEDALEFVAGSSTAVAWGAITGTLADQTDLTTALGLKQTADATLTALAGLSTSADKLIYATGADAFALTTLTTFSRGLLGQADAASWKSALGVSGGGTSDLKNLVTDYGAVADFVLGPGAIKVSGTDNSTALANAIASGYPIYVPAGNYWISDLTVRYNMQWANLSGPGVFYGSTNVGYAILGKTLAIGSIRSHESGSVGGLNIGGEGGQLGMRQWMGHHNWMQFQPLKYGAPGQVQIYSSNPMGFFYPVATNQIRVCTYTGSTSGVTFPTSSTANTTYGIDVGDIISAGGIQYTVSAVSSTNITLAARSGGDAPAFTAGQISAHTVFVWSSSYETSTGTCNASGSTITWTGGEEIVSTMEHCTIRFVGDATIYTVTGYNWATNTLTISGSKTGTNLSYIQKGHDPGTYQTLMRLQGVAGGAETNCFINYTPNQDMIIGNNGASANYVGRTMFALNSGGTFGRHYWSFNSTPSYKSHTHTGESLRVYSWPSYTDHITIYGSVYGTNNGPELKVEGSSTNADLLLTPKGSGVVHITANSLKFPDGSTQTTAATSVVEVSPNGSDDTASIQAAINALGSQGGTVQLSAGQFWAAGIVIPSNVTLAGRGMYATTIGLSGGANIPLIKTTNVDSLWNTDTINTVRKWGIRDLKLWGNKTQNTLGHGIYTYSFGFLLENVAITDFPENGIRSRWGTGGMEGLEALLSHVQVNGSGKEGIYWDGPHDSVMDNVVVSWSSSASVGTYDGIYFGTRANGIACTNVHSWWYYHRYAFNVNCTPASFNNCIADQATTALVKVNGHMFTWMGGQAYKGEGYTNLIGFDLGGTTAIENVHISCPVVHCHTTVKFTNVANTQGYINITGTALGTASYGYQGTPPSNVNVVINVYGAEFNDSYYNTSADIHLGPNKFNWGTGTMAGTVSNEGDMLYNESNNTLFFNQGGVTTEMLACSSLGTSGSYTADRKIAVRIGNVYYYLLASTTA